MNESNVVVDTTLRIPGTWRDRRELEGKMPEGYRITSEALIMPDGREIECVPLPPDDQFAHVFLAACRQPATAEEIRRIKSYTANIALVGPGGSLEAASATLQAGAAIVRAGGAGVFIDNSVLAHGGEDWIHMTEDRCIEATSFAFVNMVQVEKQVITVGMRAMGLPDIVVPFAESNHHSEVILDVIRSMCHNGQATGDGHPLPGQAGPYRLARDTASYPGDEVRCMRNPFGRLKLLPGNSAAEHN